MFTPCIIAKGKRARYWGKKFYLVKERKKRAARHRGGKLGYGRESFLSFKKVAETHKRKTFKQIWEVGEGKRKRRFEKEKNWKREEGKLLQ